MSKRTILNNYDQKIVYLTPPHAPSLVTTIGPEGNFNIGAFEQTMTCSNFPPCILLAVSPKSDTLSNILRTHEFVIGFPTSKIINEVYAAGEKLPPNESEFELTGLTPLKSELIAPPRIEECQVNFECILQWAKSAGDHWIVVGHVVLIDILTDLLVENKIEQRCGLDSVYYATSGIFIKKGEIVRANKDDLISNYNNAKKKYA